jgi:aromatic-L-amino-acid decarboxylase
MALGFGHENLVAIAANQRFEMRADLLERAVADDRARGMLPLAVVATVGTTATTSVDPVPAIADICARYSLWLHVDASYAGVAAIVPERRDTLAGVESADSLVVNPHKWLFTPVDISALYTRRPDVLKRAFALVPEYLTTAEQDVAVNLMDYGVQLGRRFRALKLWMVIRAFGVEGIIDRLRAHMQLARDFASWVENENAWQLMAPVTFSLVCFRYAPPGLDEAMTNQLNQAILERVNASGSAFLSHTKLNGQFTLRLAIGNLRTEKRHVENAWDLVRDAAGVLLKDLDIITAEWANE